MNILPYQIHNILKIYRNPVTQPKPSDPATSVRKDELEPDRVEITDDGRKEQIKREIVTEIIKKIR